MRRSQGLEELSSGVARNLIWGVYVLTSHCNFKTCANVPHVNKTATDFEGTYTDIPSSLRRGLEGKDVKRRNWKLSSILGVLVSLKVDGIKLPLQLQVTV